MRDAIDRPRHLTRRRHVALSPVSSLARLSTFAELKSAYFHGPECQVLSEDMQLPPGLLTRNRSFERGIPKRSLGTR
jgi:hypothetical protein